MNDREAGGVGKKHPRNQGSVGTILVRVCMRVVMSMIMAMAMAMAVVVVVVAMAVVVMIVVVVIGRRIWHCGRLGAGGYYAFATRRLFLCPAVQGIECWRRQLVSGERDTRVGQVGARVPSGVPATGLG